MTLIPLHTNISEIINKYRHLLETDDILKQSFPKNSIIVASKRRRNLQDLLTRADPYNIKSDSLDLNVDGYKKFGKKCDSCNNFVDETSFVLSKTTGRKYSIRRDSTYTTKMLYIWFIVQNVGNKERVLLYLGNLAYSIIKVTLNNPSILAK